MKTEKSSINEPINHLSDKEKKWFAIHTKYKCEKYVADKLARKGIATYVPIIEKSKRYTSRIKRYQVPLINCYVFTYIDKEEYIKVLETEYVFGFLKQGKNLISIPEKEINTLKVIVGEMENVESGDYILDLGDEVEIISGSLTGIRGHLIKKEGKHSFCVRLVSIGIDLLMSVDIKQLRLIRRRATA